MIKITVFLGSKEPSNDIYIKAVTDLGMAIGEYGHTLVYGGAKVGTMGVLADVTLKHEGQVIGIMPHVLAQKERIHNNLSQTILVDSMHERKAQLQELGDIFIAMPGGCGTMEEIFEVITWNQIGIHNKPYAFININGFYDGIKAYFDLALNENFISKKEYDAIHFFDSIESFFTSDLLLKLKK